MASSAASERINQDMRIRQWATNHGGVYVPPNQQTPPNPYLNHPQRDVTTTSGIALTLMNPAYVLRDIHENYGDPEGILTRIISLAPMNPQNAPDNWEIKVLNQFKHSLEPVQELREYNEETYLRLMKPFIAQASCLKCHAQQGYQVGDVLGGIGTAVPIKLFSYFYEDRGMKLVWSHMLIWLIGVAGFGLGWRRERFLNTERLHKTKQLEENEALYRTMTNNGQALIWIADLDKLCTFFNRPWLDFTGRTLDQELGNGWTVGVHPDDLTHCLNTYQTAFDARQKFSMIYRLKRHDGEYRWIVDEGTPRYDAQGQFVGYIGHGLDITDVREARTEIDYLTNFDLLTQLPNRQLITQYLMNTLQTSKKTQQYGAVILIDLDNFKLLNESQGHDVGDELLQKVAVRLTDLTQSQAKLGRFSGDEFMILLENLSNNIERATTKTNQFIQTVMQTLGLPYQLAHHDYQTTCSVGVMLFQGDHHLVDDLIKSTEVAMYRAKENGRNTFKFFDPSMQVLVMKRSELERDLRSAINKQEFVLYLQPQVDQDGHIMGAEALIRWAHPKLGILTPGEFIQLAEETGLILPLGHWALQQACQILVRWATQPALASLTLSVNISARQLHQTDFVEQTLHLIEQCGANPHKLKLEITESMLVVGIHHVMSKMHQIKANGVRFSLDDFGTGYSSLSYLKQLPLDQLKIDQSFVQDILIDKNDVAIAKMVVALSESLGLDVIAEGVETLEQQAVLAQLGCFHYQGYLYGHPSPIDEFETLVLEANAV
ncbi:EAL domain-containing protein [Thiomicrospira sp.]|uniref:EAL domain-containing protein n=1 Tax=Thiomicrospira sp. TaxID=935 RepID=UPI0025E5BD4F|nr:EAL domain-containing protein [Thiomicrospira sp.]